MKNLDFTINCVSICTYRQPEFFDWAFNLRRGEQCLEKWDLIPEGIDILITHGPPIGHGDLCSSNLRAGECVNCVINGTIWWQCCLLWERKV